MRLRLAELQESDEEAWRIRVEGLNGYEELDEVLYHQRLPFIPKAIQTEIISRYHDDFLAEHFSIDKTKDLIGWKYYWQSFQKDIETYVKGCDICLGSQAVRHKPYGDLQSLPILTYWWKNLTLDFVTGLWILTDWKSDSYDSIQVIVDRLMKMVHYEPVKVTINIPRLVEEIIKVVVRYHALLDCIISDRGAVFTSKF